jgi:hypothetical protein
VSYAQLTETIGFVVASESSVNDVLTREEQSSFIMIWSHQSCTIIITFLSFQYGDFIYWTEWQAIAVGKAHKLDGSQLTTIASGLSNPRGIQINLPNVQTGLIRVNDDQMIFCFRKCVSLSSSATKFLSKLLIAALCTTNHAF